MKYVSILICFIFLGTTIFANSLEKLKTVAVVNGEKISKKRLVNALKERYGPAADALRMRIIRSVLEEIITFKVMEQNLKKNKVEVTKKEWVAEAKRLEKPLFDVFKKWGLKNYISFCKKLLDILPKSPKSYEKYSTHLKKIKNKLQIDKKDAKQLLEILDSMRKDKKLRRYVRKMVLKKYRLPPADFIRRAKLAAQLRKYASLKMTKEEVQKMITEEKFALAGGQVKISHIMLYIVDPHTKEVFTEKEREKTLQRIKKIRRKVKPDISNFAAVAKQYSEDEYTKFNGGNLGWTSRWPLFAKNMIKHAFSLAKGKLSKPIKTDFGYHLIIVTDKKKGKKLSKKQLQKKAKEQIINNKKEVYLKQWFKNGKIERFLRD